MSPWFRISQMNVLQNEIDLLQNIMNSRIKESTNYFRNGK